MPEFYCSKNRVPRLISGRDLLDLAKLKFNRRRPAKDRDSHLDARTLFIDLFHDTRERSEGTFRHFDVFPDLEGDRGLGTLDAFLHLVKDSHRLILGNRHRLIIGAEEACDLGRVLDENERRVGHFHFDEHVAGEELAFRVDFCGRASLR